MLKLLSVNNYKTLVNFDLKLGSQNLLLGANGSGKSSVFEVLALLRDVCTDFAELEGRVMGETVTKWTDLRQQTLMLWVEGNGGQYELMVVFDEIGALARPRVKFEGLKFDGKPLFRFEEGETRLFNDDSESTAQIGGDWHRSSLALVAERSENSKLTWFKRWLRELRIIQPTPWAMEPIAAKTSTRPADDLSNLVSWYRHFAVSSDPSTLNAYREALAEVLPSIEFLRLEQAGGERMALMARLINGEGTTPLEFLLNQLSEGQRVLIGLYALLFFGLPEGGCLCVDEPDNFVSLREIQPWLLALQERTEEGSAQALVISHHPEIINWMGFTDGLLFERPTGRETVVTKFSDGAETGLSAAELVARGWEHGE